MPRISVLLSSLNHAKFVAEAIQSVLDQTFTDFELIIIDDCSDDDSWNVIQRFRDPRIRTFRNAERRRGAAGFNDAIRSLAQGEYVAIHHSDDRFVPAKLEKQVDFLDAHPEIGAVFSRVQLIDENGAPFEESGHHYTKVFDQPNRSRHEWLHRFFYQGNCLCHPSALIRKECFSKAGPYDRRFGQAGDLDMWVRLAMHYEIHVLEEPLVQFRIRDNEANESGNRPESHIRGRLEWVQILKRYLAIKGEADFFRIFPEASAEAIAGGNNLPFLLARQALRNGQDVQQAFGIGVLYDLMQEPATVAELEAKYGFTYLDLISLAGDCDIFRMRQTLALQETHNRLKNELERVTSTLSWRFTKPFRFFGKLFRS